MCNVSVFCIRVCIGMYVFGCCWTSSLAFNGYVTMYVFWSSIGWIYTMHVRNICSFFVTNVVSSTI